ncbi:hypothetical protein F5X99DRAFT_378680 [Biscogniauxia marginata]|nr:hypothetical protein F5X99DRAFT_378680 [Biscogniauxia marginata]
MYLSNGLLSGRLSTTLFLLAAYSCQRLFDEWRTSTLLKVTFRFREGKSDLKGAGLMVNNVMEFRRIRTTLFEALRLQTSHY